MRVHQLVGAGVVAVFVAAGLLAAQQQGRPVLRAGAYLVQVDAYPVKDGEPIRGLTADSFDLLEDGKPQVIDSVRFLEFPLWTPDQQRRDPNSQRESYELAGDPSHRLFFVYLNRMTWQNGSYVVPALFEFLDRSLGPDDYVAVMTALQSPGDLVFGQLTAAFKSEAKRFLSVVDWMDPAYMLPVERELLACFPGDRGKGMINARRLDDMYRDLEGLVALLGSIRDTRSTIIFVSEEMPVPADPTRAPASTRSGTRPPVLIPPAGQLPVGRGRGSFVLPGTEIPATRCQGLGRATGESWSPNRFKDLLAQARLANVSLNPINPAGLFASPYVHEWQEADRRNDTFITMASETGGLAIVNTNDMREGFRRVANAMASHYVLGYYSTNREQDGRIRRITVRLKGTRDTVRARREYRALSASEPVSSAPLSMPPEGLVRALGELEASERVDSEPRALHPGLHLLRAASPPAAPWQSATSRRFFRNERLRLEWSGPVLPSDVRLLNRDGEPLTVSFAMATDDTRATLTASMVLAPLAPGPYVVEVTMPDGSMAYVAFRLAI